MDADICLYKCKKTKFIKNGYSQRIVAHLKPQNSPFRQICNVLFHHYSASSKHSINSDYIIIIIIVVVVVAVLMLLLLLMMMMRMRMFTAYSVRITGGWDADDTRVQVD